MARLRPSLIFCLFALLAGAPLRAATPAEAMRLLKANCFSCHNDEKKKGGLVMTSREALLQGGDSGAALAEGSPAKSELIASLEPGADPHMPPKKQLTPAQIATLKEWVQSGAKWDAAALQAPVVSAPRVVKLGELPPTYHPVLSLALSPAGDRLAAGWGHELLLYAVGEKSLTLLGRASAHPDPIQSIAWSPDGAQLATGAFRRVVLWNSDNLACTREITAGLTDRITVLRFLPEQQLVIADGRVAESGIVRVAETATGAITASWTAHSDTIFDLAVSADGHLLATAGGDKLVKIWDLATRKETARLEGHVAQVLSVAFNQAGDQLATGGADQELKVWDVKTRERILSLGSHNAAINAVAWTPGPQVVLAVTAAGQALSYTELKAHTGATSRETSAKERKLEAADTALYCLASSRAADRIFAGADDGRLFYWNKDGKLVATVQPGEMKTTAALAK